MGFVAVTSCVHALVIGELADGGCRCCITYIEHRYVVCELPVRMQVAALSGGMRVRIGSVRPA